MLWLIFSVIGVALIVAAVFFNKRDREGLELFFGSAGVVFIAVVLILATIHIINHSGIDAKIAEKNMTRDDLVYQLENDIYENDNDLGKRDLYEDIQEWNADIVYKQNAQDDLMIGFLYPDIYDQFEVIEFKKGK